MPFADKQFVLFLNLLQSMIGHCLGAAGGLEAIATVKAITTGWLHPTINQFVCDTNLCLTLFFCWTLLDFFFFFLRICEISLSLPVYVCVCPNFCLFWQ